MQQTIVKSGEIDYRFSDPRILRIGIIADQVAKDSEKN